jgi:peptidyl-prolyl cis-trans isomerase C
VKGISVSSIKYLLVVAVILLMLVHAKIAAQTPRDVIAKAGSISISNEEFKKRFEFSPHPRNDGGIDSTFLKREFLNTLIAEKLLTQAAIKEGYESSPEYLQAYNYMRNFYLRDALYKIEVKDKTVIPDSEIIKGKTKIGKKIFSKFIFSQDEEEITNLYSALIKGCSFDSILATRPETKEQASAEEIAFGKMNEKMENAMFKTKVGEVTPPIELSEGWYICKIYSISNKNDIEQGDLKKIEQVVKDRMYDKTYQEFYKKFFKGIVVNSDQHLFRALWKSISEFVKNNKNTLVKKNGKYTLFEKEVNEMRKSFSPIELTSVYIKFQKDPVTFNGFLDFMSNEGFEFRSTDSLRIGSRLNTYVATYIQNEILAREALKRGYDKLMEVESDLKIWREYFLSNLKMKQLYKKETVSDEEVYKFFVKNNKIIPKPEEFKLAQILADSLETVQKIYSELEEGKDFRELAKYYAKHGSYKKFTSELDSNQIDNKGKIWEIVQHLKVGEVYGPIKLPEGYAILKLLDRKKQKRKRIESFDEAKSDIKNILQSEKMKEKLNDFAAKLALDNKLEINEKALDAVKVNITNMVVYRRFGFGGQQITVPYLPNFSSWMKKYEALKKSLSF